MADAAGEVSAPGLACCASGDSVTAGAACGSMTAGDAAGEVSAAGLAD